MRLARLLAAQKHRPAGGSWAAAALSLAVALSAPACRDDIPPEVDGWEVARAALLSGEHCFAGRKEYCITDPAFVDAAIQPRLDELYGGKMPPRRIHVDAIARAAAQRYKRATMRPENLARVEELVRERYHNPVITEKDDLVSADLGVVPGKLDGHPGTLTLSVTESPLVDQGRYDHAEVARVLGMLEERYPEKRVLRMTVTLPWGRDLGGVSYRLFRSPRRLVITDYRGEMRTSPWLEPGPIPESATRFFDLPKCALSLEPAPANAPPALCPPDIDPLAPSPLAPAAPAPGDTAQRP